MSKKPLHIHRYKRHSYKTGTLIFFCTNGSCTHKIEVALALGKPNLCNVCGKEFNLDEYALRLSKPRCINCRKHKDGTPLVEKGSGNTTTVSSLMDRLRAATSGSSDEPSMAMAGDKDEIL